MNKYTIAQIMEAWDAAYDEDMYEECLEMYIDMEENFII